MGIYVPITASAGESRPGEALITCALTEAKSSLPDSCRGNIASPGARGMLLFYTLKEQWGSIVRPFKHGS